MTQIKYKGCDIKIRSGFLKKACADCQVTRALLRLFNNKRALFGTIAPPRHFALTIVHIRGYNDPI